MITLTTCIRVRYSETDQMGFVYYGNYAQYFEVGRVELFRMIGMPYKYIENSGYMLPVADLNIKYIKSARYDDELSITTKIKEIPTGVRIFFEYEIRNQLNELLCTGSTTLLFMNKETYKLCRCPKNILELMDPFYTKKH